MSDLTIATTRPRSCRCRRRRTELFTYVYQSAAAQYESPRPFVHPLRTLAGAGRQRLPAARPSVACRAGLVVAALRRRQLLGRPELPGRSWVRAAGQQRRDATPAYGWSRSTDGVFTFAHDLDWYRADEPLVRRPGAPHGSRLARRLGADLRDVDGERQRGGHHDRLAHHGGPAERRLRRPVLARPALVHRRHRARPGRRDRRSAARAPRTVDGITGQHDEVEGDRRRRDGRRPDERGRVVRPLRTVRAVARPRSSPPRSRWPPASRCRYRCTVADRRRLPDPATLVALAG